MRQMKDPPLKDAPLRKIQSATPQKSAKMVQMRPI